MSFSPLLYTGNKINTHLILSADVVNDLLTISALFGFTYSFVEVKDNVIVAQSAYVRDRVLMFYQECLH